MCARRPCTGGGFGPGVERQRLAIVVADVVGYSRLMQANEDATHARLTAIRHGLIEPHLASHHGRYVKSTGDGFIATFLDPRDAIACSLAVQQALQEEADGALDAEGIQLRIGLNVADVIVEPDDVYGDGVNIAARLQTTRRDRPTPRSCRGRHNPLGRVQARSWRVTAAEHQRAGPGSQPTPRQRGPTPFGRGSPRNGTEAIHRRAALH